MKKFKSLVLLLSLFTVVSCQNDLSISSNNVISSSPSISVSSSPSISINKKSFNVTFKNIDGTVLQESTVIEGNKAIFTGNTPTYKDDSNRIFKNFIGWDKSLDNPITENMIFTAQYEIEYTNLTYQFNEESNSFDVQINDDIINSIIYIPSIHSEEDKKDLPVSKILRRKQVSDEVIKQVFLGDNIETLDNSAFSGFRALEEITLGKKLKNIPAYAFQNDKKLSKVNGFEQIEVFGPSAFASTGLTFVNLGSNVIKYENTLGGNSEAEAIFSYCSNLKEVYIDNTLPIPSNMFSNCENLEKVTIKNVPEIKGQAFFEDKKLSTLTLSEGLTSIGMFAFDNTALTSVNLPTTLNSLGNFVFEKTSIENLTLHASIQTVGRGILSNAKDPSKVKITVNKKKAEMTGFDEKWAYDYNSGTTYSYTTLD